MKTSKKFHRGGVLLLVLILALNMLLPMEALAASANKDSTFISIDEVLYLLYYGDGSITWAETYNYSESWSNQLSFTFDAAGHVIVDGKYITSDGVTPIMKTDVLPKGATNQDPAILYTMAIPLDFTAPESLSMRVTQGHSDLTIDPCVITNTGAEDLKLSQVEITAASGWTVVNASTDFTTADSKNKIAFTAGSHDFANGASTPGETIAAGSNTTLQLAGKISEKADLTNATQVASMVLTVEKVEIISFTISGTSYQAEAGMTWAEWVDSSYNVDRYINDKDMGIYNREYGIAVGINFATPVDPDDVITAEKNYRGVVSGGANN